MRMRVLHAIGISRAFERLRVHEYYLSIVSNKRQSFSSKHQESQQLAGFLFYMV